METLNILVIGGSGFLSGTLSRMSVAAGHKVWALTRGKRNLPEGVIGLKADRHNIDELKRVVFETKIRWDAVVDCIAFSAEDAKTDIAFFKNKADHLIFISTDFVYDPKRRTFPQVEDNCHFSKCGYGGNKRFCELEFLRTDTSPMHYTIIRPCHIYGPGKPLGCLPMHEQDKDLITKLKNGDTLKLVGGGIFLQQPIFVEDLVRLILSCLANPRTFEQVYAAAGPEIIESGKYYRLIADILGVDLKIEEIPISKYLSSCPPGYESFVCHRIYDLKKLHSHGLNVPITSMKKGIEATMTFSKLQEIQ